MILVVPGAFLVSFSLNVCMACPLIQVSAEMLLPQKDFTYPLSFKEPLGDSVSLLCLVVIIALFTIYFLKTIYSFVYLLSLPTGK